MDVFQNGVYATGVFVGGALAGFSTLSRMYLGTAEVKKAYFGETLLGSESGVAPRISDVHIGDAGGAAITEGVRIGTTLYAWPTLDRGNPEAAVNYQWRIDGSAVGTGPSFKAETAGALTVFLRAENRAGSAVLESPPVEVKSDAPLAVGATNLVQSLWTGAVTNDSITATARTASTTGQVVLVASTDLDFVGQIHSAPIRPDSSHYYARGTINGLNPGTVYYLGVAVSGTIDTTRVGRFRTAPAGTHSFAFAMSSCSGTGSGSTYAASSQQIYNNIRKKAEEGDIEFFVQMGDLHYKDITSSNPASWHAAFDHVFDSPRQNAAYRNCPTYYTWDDHDFGPNDSHGFVKPDGAKYAYRDAAISAYRARVPSPSLVETAADGGIYYSFTRGRLRFVVTDLRSYSTYSGTNGSNSATEPTKTKLGAAQKAWFKAELQAAKASGQGVCWVNAAPWHTSNDPAEDHWGSFSVERQELADFISAEGMSGRMFAISGDMHALAYVSAASNTRGNFPICHAAPLDRSSSNKLRSYSLGPFPNSTSVNTSNFGVIEIADAGVDTVSVRFRGIGVSRASGSKLDVFGAETTHIDTTFSLSIPVLVSTTPTIGSAHISTAQNGSAASSPQSIGTTLWAVATNIAGHPSPTNSYQWAVNTVNVLGASAESFNTSGLKETDVVTVQITATNKEGSASATSAGITIKQPVPAQNISVKFLGFYTTAVSGRTNTTYTLENVNLGAAPNPGQNKVIVLGLSSRLSGSGATAPTVNFVGYSATQVSNQARTSSETHMFLRTYSGLESVTESSITVRHSSRIKSYGVAVWAIYGASYAAADSAVNSGADPAPQVTVSAGGAGIRFASNHDPATLPAIWFGEPINKSFEGTATEEALSGGHWYNQTAGAENHHAGVTNWVASKRLVTMAFGEQN